MSKYFNGDKLNGYEDSPITYVHGEKMLRVKGVVMEEKERYEIHIYDDICVDLYDNGVLDKSINDTYKLEKLLNQQSKRLKELEQENQKLKNQARKAYREGLLQKQFDKDMEIQELKYKIEQLKQSQKQLANGEIKIAKRQELTHPSEDKGE